MNDVFNTLKSAELPQLEPLVVLDAVLSQVGDQAVDDLLHVELLPGIPVASPHNIYEGQRCSEC